MKSTTVLMVAFSFVAGLGLGLSGPLAKAGEGLIKVIAGERTAVPHADRITASFETQRGGFQPADFRWPMQQATASNVVCAPKDDAAHKPFEGVQHL
jgi:hypothetical protein